MECISPSILSAARILCPFSNETTPHNGALARPISTHEAVEHKYTFFSEYLVIQQRGQSNSIRGGDIEFEFSKSSRVLLCRGHYKSDGIVPTFVDVPISENGTRVALSRHAFKSRTGLFCAKEIIRGPRVFVLVALGMDGHTIVGRSCPMVLEISPTSMCHEYRDPVEHHAEPYEQLFRWARTFRFAEN